MKFILTIALLLNFTFCLFSQDDFYDITNVQEIRIYFNEANWRHVLDSLFTNIGESGRLAGDVTINGKQFKNAGIRYKGFSSYDADNKKNPFNIDLDYTIENQNYKGYKKIKLSNVIGDPSFVREVLSYEIARKYMPASKANFANVYVNDTLQGLYTNVEAVDKIFVKTRFGSKSNSFFKGSPAHLVAACNGANANLAYKGADTTVYKSLYKMESDSGWNELIHLTYVLNNQTDSIANVLNIDRALWMHAFNYALLNMDSYIGYSQNYYLYKDDNGIFNTIPWDFNLSFGSFRFSDGTCLNINPPYYCINIPNMKKIDPLRLMNYSYRPLFKNLLLNSSSMKMYLAHMRTIVNENLKNAEYYTKGKIIQNIINTHVQNDLNKFYSYDFFITNFDTTTGTGDSFHQIPGIKDIVNGRVAYLDTFPGFNGAPVISDINHSPEYPVNRHSTWITAKVINTDSVILAYRFAGSNVFSKTRMYDDGNHNDGLAGDSIFGTAIILNGHTLQYYIWAENDVAGIFSPERAEYEFYTIQPLLQPGEIVINEFMQSGNATSSDSVNTQNGWIEIFNPTKENINLNHAGLTDDSENPSKWTFPDTVIHAGKYIIIWDKNENSLSGFHSNLQILSYGGCLLLTNQNQAVIDSVFFTQSIDSKTIGRFPNGTGYFTYMVPSFSKYNYTVVTPVPTSDFTIFPNPAKDIFYIVIENKANLLSIDISDINGRSMIRADVSFSRGASPVVCKTIDAAGWNKGVYFIKIICSDKTMIKKIVIC
ncbi:MAG: CotH kinase family protein [Bacteroidia bacterium]|nr:CotH kinase family protein [Bacteroidia bacterium]